MDKALVAYFSCSGVTKKVAETLAKTVDSDLYEIEPAVIYTKADLNWNDKNSRSSIEMNDKAFRPAISGKVKNMDQYDTVFVGFPIWWYIAPTIINTFLETYDFSGKTIIPFATSGGSGVGETEKWLKLSCSLGTEFRPAKRLSKNVDEKALRKWLEELNL